MQAPSPSRRAPSAMRPYRFPEDLHFTCQACGVCCRAYRVEVGPEYARDLRGKVEHAHGSLDPFETEAHSGRVFLRQVDGTCIFLMADNRCAIHAQLGYMAKPAPCRRFPFTLLGEPQGPIHVRASFFCPTVVANTGAGPDEHARAFEEDSSPIGLPEAYRLGSGTISAEVYGRLEDMLADIISTQADPGRGLAVSGALVHRVSLGIAREGPAAVTAVLDEYADPIAFAALSQSVVPTTASARRLLAPFLWLAVPTESGRITHALDMLRLLLDRGRVRTVLGSEPLDLGRHRRTRLPVDLREISSLGRRYVLHLLRSRALLADLDPDIGFYLVGVAFALVRWYSRALAVLGGREVVSGPDVVQAVRTVDRFHLGHNQGEPYILKRRLAGRMLRWLALAPAAFASLVIERD